MFCILQCQVALPGVVPLMFGLILACLSRNFIIIEIHHPCINLVSDTILIIILGTNATRTDAVLNSD